MRHHRCVDFAVAPDQGRERIFGCGDGPLHRFLATVRLDFGGKRRSAAQSLGGLARADPSVALGQRLDHDLAEAGLAQFARQQVGVVMAERRALEEAGRVVGP